MCKIAMQRKISGTDAFHLCFWSEHYEALLLISFVPMESYEAAKNSKPFLFSLSFYFQSIVVYMKSW